MSRQLVFLFAAGMAACGGAPPNPDDPDDAARMGRTLIEHALEQARQPVEPGAGRPFLISGTGTLDKAAEGQGFTPDKPSPGPFRERLAFDLTGRRAAREYREDRFDGTVEHLTELHGADSILTFVVHTHDLAVPRRAAGNADAARALRRRLPHELLAEVARDGATPRWIGSDNEGDQVTALLEDGTAVTLAFDPTHGMLHSLRYDTVLTGRGRVTLAWTWSDWRTVPGIGRFPFRYASTVGDLTYIDVFVDSVTAARDSDFTAPAAFRMLPLQSDTGAPIPPLEFRSVAPGVFVVPSVRSGFAPMVIERARDLIVVDAPASFPLLGSIPLTETDPGSAPGWVSERFAAAIDERFPTKPVGFLILTHGHHDHAAGLGAFVARGATVVAHSSLRETVTRWWSEADAQRADRDASEPRSLEFMEVVDSLQLEDPLRPVRMLVIQPNPHAEGLLAVHIPSADILFVSDLITPGPLDSYPRSAHAALDLAFLDWFDRVGFRPAPRILSMHGSAELTADHIARLRRLVSRRNSVSGS